MQEGDTSGDLDIDRWDIAIAGHSLDDRGNAAIDFIEKNSDSVVFFEYDSEDFSVQIDGNKGYADDLEDFFATLNKKKIILEATTLGFTEIFLCCRSFHNLGFGKASFLYVEPLNYQKHVSSLRRSQILHRRDFGLSDEIPGYKAIPGATLLLNSSLPQKTVFFLGFEERRLDRALEDHPMIDGASASAVFGVPAFNPGWEMDAFANNIRVIKERDIRGGIHFCGAENPASTLDVLMKIRKELEPGERLLIAPIGTKPMGIGSALFAAVNNNVGILYDHPKRRKDRSSNIGKWHLYSAEFP